MSVIQFENGMKVQFDGTPTERDVEEVFQHIQRTSPVKADASAAAFPADPQNETMTSAPLKLLGNLPGSAWNFAKGAIDAINPLSVGKKVLDAAGAIKETVSNLGAGETAKQFAKNLPGAAADVLIPQFFHHLSKGDTDSALKVLVEDPVGQLAPVLLAARGVAEKAGTGAQFDSAVESLTKPVKTAVTAPAKVAGRLATDALGITTGAGGESVRTAFEGGKEFTDAMRGNTSMEEVAQETKDAISTLADKRSQQYRARLTGIKSQTQSLDISPIHETFNRQLADFGVRIADDGSLDFSRSTLMNNKTAQTDVSTVYENLKNWGSQPGDRTPIGLDTLKRSLDDVYSDSSNARSLVQAVRRKTSEILKKEVPGYDEMTKGYEQYSNLLKEMKRSLGQGDRVGIETSMRKLMQAMKQNNEVRLELLKQLEGETGVNIRDQIAGAQLSEKMPRGYIGKGIDLYVVSRLFQGLVNPTVIAEALAASPRFVGEFMNALGGVTRATGRVLKPLNKVPSILIRSVIPQKQK